MLIDSLEGDDSETSGLVARGRTYGEAPEIDPQVLLSAGTTSPPDSAAGLGAGGGFRELPLRDASVRDASVRDASASVEPGRMVRARITGSRDYDVLATPL